MLDGHLVSPTTALSGFDCNQQLNGAQIKALHDHGFSFAIRYVRRLTINPQDLTAAEAAMILAGGLGLMAVQHVESGKWTPSDQKGYNYGQSAVEHATRIGLPPGTMIWLDLEEVEDHVPHSMTISYCNTWHCQVAAAGFLPGLYVGDSCGLSAAELYQNLRFTHYWSAYNLNSDQVPLTRGVQLKQATQQTIAGVTLDPDYLQRDHLGSVPALLTQWKP